MTEREGRRSLLDAVEETIAALDPEAVDQGLVELARLYARQIDRASATAAMADRAARLAASEDDDGALMEIVAALRAKLTERDTIDKIGARLTVALVELKATPKARAAGSSGGAGKPSAGPSRLTGLRGGRGAGA